jgi:hypothetical protein
MKNQGLEKNMEIIPTFAANFNIYNKSIRHLYLKKEKGVCFGLKFMECLI